MPPAGTVEPFTSRYSFASLPPELRNEVYRYLFRLPDESDDLSYPWDPFKLHTSIIYTNRLIAQESTAILYGEATISLPVTYRNDLFRVDETNNNKEKLPIKQGHRETLTKSDIQRSSTRHTGLIYPHVFTRIRHLKLDVEFSCCSRQHKCEPWNFRPEWVAAALRKTVKVLAQGGILEELVVEVHTSKIGGREVPTPDAVSVALEPLRAMKRMKDVKIMGPDRSWDMLFVAKLIWDMMASCDGGD